jgi:hypothetical protein
MGSLLRPVGSLPQGVYWFRRCLVAGVVLVVLLGGWWVLGSFGGQGSAASSPPATPTGSHTPASSATSSPSVTHRPSATKSSATAAGPATCPDSVIRVLAVTSEASYSAGAAAKLTVQVTNTSAVPCKRDLGQAALELLVYAGKTRVWSSDDCNPGGGHAVVTMKAGQTFSSTVQWARQTSVPGCPSARPTAAPGAYQLVARSLALRSAPSPFSLL